MSRDKQNTISEEEKSKLRESAIVKEFSRLSKSLRKKRQIIVFYRITVSVILISFCAFIYFNPVKQADKKNTQVKHLTAAKLQNKSEFPTISPKKKVPTNHYYTVYFENESSHPLAQFPNKKQSEEFSRVLKKMQLPKTHIVKDSIYRNRKNLQTEIYPFRYAVQLGAYQTDILEKYRSNLIWIVDQEDDQYFKYRIAPFYGYSKSRAFANKINLKETYILPF
ncbi:hypothetical protein [Marinifilum caeruleilacunae]|uniref:SPOR domain-containing protein n=1 Tax=Marinifilum caeruleilacunae TaxID=2499076 RepID=A0ABX1WQN2_9BACT|nr:hypothetical protein [Marinifilum caeruleilacunae]NOU58395.1 hypothetical protein [Marinifilum caeruleilacunae]